MIKRNSKAPLGATLALAAAAAFAAMPVSVVAAEGDQVHCGGINACKGQADCKTASNACKGQNACKGKGFKAMSADDCEEAGGQEIKS